MGALARLTGAVPAGRVDHLRAADLEAQRAGTLAVGHRTSLLSILQLGGHGISTFGLLVVVAVMVTRPTEKSWSQPRSPAVPPPYS